MSAEQLKTLGNEAFSSNKFDESIEYFTKAIELDSKNHILYSNRSASFCSVQKYDEALQDAEKAIELKPDWSKGYGRKAAALTGNGQLKEAVEVYKVGLAIDPQNQQLAKGLESVQASISRQSQDSGLGGMINAIMNDMRFAKYLAQPDFMAKMMNAKANPSTVNELFADARFMEIMQQFLGPKSEGDQHGCGSDCSHDHGESEKESPKQESAKESQEDVEMKEPTEEDSEKKQKALDRVASDKEKELGNKKYSAKQFDEALLHYSKALEIDQTNVAVLNNEAAVYFEQNRFEECIKKCEDAIEKGRDLRVDYKVIAKAFSRIGSSYCKLEDFGNAIKFFNKSLTEFRDPAVLQKLKEAEKAKLLKEKAQLYDPVLAETERNLGNDLYKQGKFADAIKHYSIAIKHDEKDPRAYSNRAACYQKLSAIPEAQKDCETCIQLDPKFIKAHIRLASIYFLKKEFEKCLSTCDTAMELDTERKHSNEIYLQKQKCYESMPQQNQDETAKKAMQDPEIQQILSDPVMQSILQQIQSEPKAFREHMKNPMISAKIQKLINSGIIRTA